jgi:phage gp46-like protein
MSEYAEFLVPPLPSIDARADGMSSRPVSDLLMVHTRDGGEIEFINGQPTMCDGRETAAYLSLFGGNLRDAVLPATDRKQWWGNLGETDPARMYRSRTQNLLATIPAIPANLRRLEDAAAADLAWMKDSFAKSVTVTASIPRLNTVTLAITIVVDDVTYEYSFTQQWGAAA